MEGYKVLGVDEHASMDVVRKAYEKKVEEFKREIQDPKKLKKYLKYFDKAYEEIKEDKEKFENEETVFMSTKDIQSKGYFDSEKREREFEEEEKIEEKRLFFEEWDDDDFEDYEEEKTERRTVARSTSSNRNQSQRRNVTPNSKIQKRPTSAPKKKVVKKKEKLSVSIIDAILKPLNKLDEYFKEL